VIADGWANDIITDLEFIDALEYLIGDNIININGTDYDNMEAEALEWKGKFETAESQRVAQSQRLGEEHQVLYDEKDAKYESLKNNHDSMVKNLNSEHDTEIAEYTDIIHQRDAEIEDLKQQLKEKLN